MQDVDWETALGTLRTGEPHHARSALAADCLPAFVISTPSVSAGAKPVLRFVFPGRSPSGIRHVGDF
jgi:hypothetical protein